MRARAAQLIFVALFAVLTLAAGCAANPSATTPSPPPLDPPSADWTVDLAAFAAQDAADPPPQRPVVFTGSSSIRLWQTLAEDFPGVPTLNRGFGGSQLRDVAHYADTLAIQYRPRMIVIYGGDNDINAGRDAQQVLSDFRAVVARIRSDLPDVPIVYLSIKPSPSRESQLATQREANAAIRAEAARWPRVEFVDVATPMLDAGGRPRPELFVEDRLHMNRDGYALWRRIVAPHLK
ncbi:GDSL-type esterase/lipase family protein [Luteimonas sp. SX5]|uniref:GDSL-type esterase/lipase family protein n=1 Tax=Luteimonas galliterrae TaxID=2940486 RepID=A0ABT0MHW4_9GAMM|nr:GDSL-type esterase/lipase family protein [Luteimonas galliterrae]MCL1634471.1 GDSL-type esterase/lipase family protein [Luteimonas galliterrae]